MNYIFLDKGFEEIEAVTTIDLLRRAGISLVVVSLVGKTLVEGAHNIAIQADVLFEDVDYSNAEMLILPGGATKLGEYKGLVQLLLEHNKQEKLIAAICAAPSVLGSLGILKDKQATCYPGFESYLGESYVGGLVVESKTSLQPADLDLVQTLLSASSKNSKAQKPPTKSTTQRNTDRYCRISLSFLSQRIDIPSRYIIIRLDTLLSYSKRKGLASRQVLPFTI